MAEPDHPDLAGLCAELGHSFADITLLELALPVATAESDDMSAPRPSGDLVAEYATMAAMETVGFAAFFRDRLVAAVGGSAMLPVAVAGVIGAVRARRGGGSR